MMELTDAQRNHQWRVEVIRKKTGSRAWAELPKDENLLLNIVTFTDGNTDLVFDMIHDWIEKTFHPSGWQSTALIPETKYKTFSE